MKKNYVSNAEESSRMFTSDLLERLSKVHFSVPLFIFIPTIFSFVFFSFRSGISISHFAGYFILGLVIWTLTEYAMHRFVFHYEPSSTLGKRIHFIFHGVHHDFPKDKMRLVMPPSASIPLATMFYLIFSFWFNQPLLWAFFPGFLLGYLIYDMLHYAMHHYNFKSGIMKKIKQHHMLHHYDNPEKGYGVSSAIWDQLLNTDFD